MRLDVSLRSSRSKALTTTELIRPRHRQVIPKLAVLQPSEGLSRGAATNSRTLHARSLGLLANPQALGMTLVVGGTVVLNQSLLTAMHAKAAKKIGMG